MSDTLIPAAIAVQGDSTPYLMNEIALEHPTDDSPDSLKWFRKEEVLTSSIPSLDLSGILAGDLSPTQGPIDETTSSGDSGAIGRDMEHASLPELAHLRRLQKYHKWKRHQAEQHLNVSRTSWAVRNRLIQGRRRLLGDLSRAIRSEDQEWFLPLFHAFRTVEAACDEYDKTERLPHSDWRSHEMINTESFPWGLPQASGDVLLYFVRRISSDPDFLIRHLSCLSNREFDALIKSHSPSEPPILGGDGAFLSEYSKDNPNSSLAESFLDLGRRDFLSLLFEIAGPDPAKASYPQSTQYWARICSTLLSDQKQGAERFVVAVMNAWPNHETQPNPHPLETWLLEVLKDGQFLLDRSDKYSFRMRARSRENFDTDDADSADSFFTRSMNSLLEILKNTIRTGAIPNPTLKLGQTIVNELRASPKQFQAAPYFLCTRWLFSSYLKNLIRNPESYCLLLSYHISTSARRRILDELAARLQKLAFDVAHTWKHYAPVVDPKLLQNMQAVVSLFRPDEVKEENEIKVYVRDTGTSEPSEYMDLVTLCPSDVLTLVHGLFPLPALNQEPSVLSPGGSTVRSSASSISGFSLFRNGPPDSSFKSGDDPLSTLGSGPPLSTGIGQDPSSSQQKVDESSLTAELNSICSNLAISHGIGVAATHNNPLCEPWIDLSLSQDVLLSHARSLPDSHMDPGSEGESDVQSIPDQVKQALDLVLDRLGDIRSGSRRTIAKTTGPSLTKPTETSKTSLQFPTTIVKEFSAAASDCHRKGLFAEAQSFDLACSWIKMMLRADPTASGLSRFMSQLYRTTQLSIEADRSATDRADIQADEFRMDRESQLSHVRTIADNLCRLREKMWYISSVRSAGKYEDLLRATCALKTMGLPARPTLGRIQPPLRHHATGNVLYEGLALKSESAVLELFAATPAHGGPNKLSDPQVKLTSDWLQYNGIENVCKGEERLHRFCLEVSRCVDSIVGDGTAEHPVLWSSELFKNFHCSSQRNHDGAVRTSPPTSARERLQELYNPRHYRPALRLSQGYAGPSIFSNLGSPSKLGSEGGFPSLERSSMGYSRSCSPTLTNSTTSTIWSSFTSGEQTSSSITSLPSHAFSRPLSDKSSHASLDGHQYPQGFLEELRRNLTSLLLSDVGNLFSSGSETDHALWDTFDGKFVETISASEFDGDGDVNGRRHHKSSGRSDISGSWDTTPQARESHDCGYISFDLGKTLQDLLHSFEISPSPYEKLKIIHQVQDIYQGLLALEDLTLQEPGRESTPKQVWPGSQTRPSSARRKDDESPKASNDVLVASFRRLFLDGSTRPKALFRDLQYIAVLVPSSTLDNSDEGHAFWNATIAALSIKQDILRSMIETADAIVAYHTFTRGHSIVSSAAQAERDSATFTTTSGGSRPDSATAAAAAAAVTQNISQYGMADAGQLYLIAAREGDPVAQRELATMYLTHPEIMKRATAPMSKVGDVFKGAAATDTPKPRRGGGRKGNGGGIGTGGGGGVGSAGVGSSVQQQQQQQKKEGQQQQQQEGEEEEEYYYAKYDPVAMAIARHWMELAAKGGDELAKNTLKATDEIERISS